MKKIIAMLLCVVMVVSVFSATGSLSQEEILKHYGIEIVSWEFSDPIENDFS